MQYILQVTLKKIEITNSELTQPKISTSLHYNNIIRKIPNARLIRNKQASFYGERLQINCPHPFSNNTVTLKIWMVNKTVETEIDNFEFDLKGCMKNLTKAIANRKQLVNTNIEFEYKFYSKNERDSEHFDKISHGSFLTQKFNQIESPREQPPKTAYSNKFNSPLEKRSGNVSVALIANQQGQNQQINLVKLDALQKVYDKEIGSPLKKNFLLQPKRSLRKKNRESQAEEISQPKSPGPTGQELNEKEMKKLTRQNRSQLNLANNTKVEEPPRSENGNISKIAVKRKTMDFLKVDNTSEIRQQAQKMKRAKQQHQIEQKIENLHDQIKIKKSQLQKWQLVGLVFLGLISFVIGYKLKVLKIDLYK